MLACSSCNHSNPGTSSFCEECGTALVDPAKAEREADEIEASFMLDRVKKARGALYAVAVLQLLGGLFEVADTPTDDQIVVVVVVGGLSAVFAGLGWWCSRSPFAAALIGLFVFVGIHALAALGDPQNIYQGIVVKVVVIAVLARAVKAGVEYRTFVRRVGLG